MAYSEAYNEWLYGELNKRFPSYNFGIGVSLHAAKPQYIFLIQYTKAQMFNRMSTDATVEVFTFDDTATPGEILTKIVSRLMLLGLE